MAALLPQDDSPSAAKPREHEYVVVARRYRPQSFEQLVGQDSVSQALGNAITTNRVGHAYLFTGARGVGKTSTARIFAKCLNCVTGPTTTPCGECEACSGIAGGEFVDVLEIDGASNRGIDEVRALKDSAKSRPQQKSSKFKIFIIDEVHMLTMQAFNALLKILEEPPEHIKFIFCTTEADKIPITVLSRCQRFDFAPIETRSIVERLALICKNEEVEADDEALQLLARRAAGSMRDSQSLLEQLLSFGGQRITVDDVHAMLGTARGSRLLQLANLLADRNAAGALADVDAAVQEGVDVGQLVEQLLGLFRDVMAAHVGCTPDLYLHATPQDAPRLVDLGTRLGLETTLAIVQILDQCLVRMKHSTHVRTLAEIAFVQICRLEDLDGLAGLIAALKSGGKLPAASASPSAAPRTAAPSRPPNVATPPPRSPVGAASGSPAPAVSNDLAAEPAARETIARPSQAEQIRIDPGTAPAVATSPLQQAQVDAAWQRVLAELGELTAKYARDARAVAISGPNRLVVRFASQYTLQKERCERADCRQELSQALARELGRSIVLDFELLPPTGGQDAAPRPVTGATRQQRLKSITKYPMVNQAIELFEAEVLQVVESEREEVAVESAASPASEESPPL